VILKWHQASAPLTMAYDLADRLTTSISGTTVTTYTFDNNGNLLEENNNGALTSYSYNCENRLLQQIGSGGSISTYSYLGNGLRITNQESSSQLLHTTVWDKDQNYLGEY